MLSSNNNGVIFQGFLNLKNIFLLIIVTRLLNCSRSTKIVDKLFSTLLYNPIDQVGFLNWIL